MPLTKLQFQPGIVRETSNYTQSGGWWMADKVRFRMGQPEKIGGWAAVINQPLSGVCRQIHFWSDLEADQNVALGTSSHLYVLWSNAYYDITPLRATTPTITLGTNPFSTVAVGENLVQANVPAHQAKPGDWVVFSGATTNCDVYTPAMLNQQFQVTSVIDANDFQITMPAPAQTIASGGGSAVTASFLIAAGQPDAVIGQGWGIPPWGGTLAGTSISVGWGQPFDPTQLDPVDPTVNQLRIWDLDNFGEDLVANIRGGPIYYWHHDDTFTRRAVDLSQPVTIGSITYTPDSDVPHSAVQVIVSPNDRHLIAFGCDDPSTGSTTPDPLLVRWSDAEDAYTWAPLRTNSAGGQRLSAGSYIICAMRTRSEIVIWTDLGLWSMQFIGAPYYFGFDSIASGLSIIGPNAMINAGPMVFWMDRGIFYAYSGGQYQELPCTLKDYIFGNFNFLQQYKVFAAHNHQFSEVTWFYPSASSQENDSYITYQYVDQVWSMGMLERTAWLDMGRDNYPIATDRTNSLLYFHEYGSDDNGSPLPAYIDSADLDNGGGDHYLFVSRVIPDVVFRGSAQQPSVGLTIFARSAPGQPKYRVADLTVTPDSGQQFVRLRERQISFRIESSELGVGWRLGTLRADMQPDGKR